MKSYHVFTHNDLDGAVSLLLFMWANPDCIITSQVFPKNKIVDAAQTYFDSVVNPPSVYFLDFNIKEDFLQFDKSNVTFIDHHNNDDIVISQFKNARIFNEKKTSNSLFFHEKFKHLFVNLSLQQKLMVLYANDYDSGKNGYSESYDLNLILWSDYRKDFSGFINYYKEGFKPFTDAQKNKVAAIKQYANEEFKKIEFFDGQLKIQNKIKKVQGGCVSKIDYLILDHIMNTSKEIDILFLIDLKEKTVAFRQKYSDDEINLAEFAEKYCNGGGNNHSARGKLTELFMEITKNLGTEK